MFVVVCVSARMAVMMIGVIMLSADLLSGGFIRDRAGLRRLDNIVRGAAALIADLRHGAGVDERSQGQK